ncbi:sigma-54 dependent transcriptional regulator [Marinobacter pelagius]|uniref:Sigma-54 specific transcriptional regulator, flagellar regulatory protein A n=1 Tax=Marinobacter pelagius TaxID=379482 RepID=A0A1I4TTD3_9GAMM|nr:sigma-54 dependent transcriptional regulator [Marinobacter pelagius]SFM79984.1 sigma-54 specific transcriptional regulator, flagellar regulatory protein A [Marinobacter pelagius]
MSKNNKVLVLSEDELRQHDIVTILEFVGEEQVIAGDEALALLADADESQREEVGVALVSGDGRRVGENLARVCEALPGVPILLVNGIEPSGLSDQCASHIIARLEWPLNYAKFVDSLYRAQIYRDQSDRSRQERGHLRGLQLFRSLVGTSRKIQHVHHLMEQVADMDVTVLITGESGTGKEVVARNLHYHSSRRDHPFVPMNCGAIPAELLESELFGHEKGAFPGAISARAGRLELAEGGTLFLDEIDALPLPLQVKLQRVLQDRTFERMGSHRSENVDVRIIAATDRSLEDMIEAGEFREDLFYSLNVFPIEMPALRERVEDIPLLINELISRMEKEKRGSLRLNSAAIMSLCRHDWPGNIRELANLIERLAIMHPYGVIGVQELPKKFRYVDDYDENRPVEDSGMPSGVPGLVGLDAPALLPVNGIDLKEYLSNLEKQLIQQALDEAGGVVARAAEKLRIRRTTLVEKVRKYGLREESAES